MSLWAHKSMQLSMEGDIALLEYQQWRMSFRAGHNNHIIAENGNCEGYLDFEEVSGMFRKRFFILNITKMKFEYYRENPKNNKCAELGNVDMKYITKVSKVSHKAKKCFSFEVNTPSKKYVLAASNESEMKNWIDALSKAAIPPRNKMQKKFSSVENLPQATSIIGGVVVKTPVMKGPEASTDSLKKIPQRTNSQSSSGMKNLYEGWCWKQGAVMKNWKRRYFRLNAVKLSYYETDLELKPIRSITTNAIKAVRILPRFCSRLNCLEVETPNRKFYMHPEQERDVQPWKQALEDIIMSSCMYIPRTKSV